VLCFYPNCTFHSAPPKVTKPTDTTMRFRLRTPSGQHTVSLDDDATINDLCTKITELTELIVYDIKSGFPPTTLDISQFSSETKLADTELKINGEQLIVASKNLPGITFAKSTAQHSASMSSTPSESRASPPKQPTTRVSGANANLPSLKRKENDVESDPPSVPISSRGGRMVLRVMPDDNSCLFRSLSACLLGNSLDGMTELRSIVAQVIQSDPETYSEAVLQKEPDKYATWIQSPDSWGGYVDIKAISEYLSTEVVSIDVQSGLVTRYCEGAQHRCFVVYSGIHYDALSFVPNGSSELDVDFDQKQFDTKDDAFLDAAIAIGKILKEKKYFTDTAGFTIKCGDCGWTGKGEKAATKHAESTGHMDFSEAS
jgi:ubiquitin thioesterase OTU1